VVQRFWLVEKLPELADWSVVCDDVTRGVVYFVNTPPVKNRASHFISATLNRCKTALLE
jgi:hypothetical protein